MPVAKRLQKIPDELTDDNDLLTESWRPRIIECRNNLSHERLEPGKSV